MRICHVASGDLWAGAEAQVFTLLAFLARQPGLEVLAVLLHERELAARLRRAGVEVVVVDQTRLDAFRILWHLTALVRERRPDVLHAHRYKETILGTIAAAATGVPAVVSTVHGFVEAEGYRGLARHKMRLNGWLERRMMGLRHDVVVAVSDDMARRLAARLEVPTATIPNAIAMPAEPAAPARLEGVGPEHVVIGTVARFVPVKGLDTLLEAARQLVRHAPGTRLLLVGDGPLLPALRARAEALGIAGAVLLPGHRPDVRPYLAAMDLFVLPSLAEGLPMALLEAMAAGLPVVATRVGGIPEVVRDGVEGRLVPPGDPAALAGACLAFVGDPVARATAGASARRRVAEAYTIEATGPRYVDLYQRLLERGRRAGKGGAA